MNCNSSQVLFAHQTMLIQYGNPMTLIDATYNTACYGLLFCRNVGFVIIATYITINEQAISIKQVLHVIGAESS